MYSLYCLKYFQIIFFSRQLELKLFKIFFLLQKNHEEQHTTKGRLEILKLNIHYLHICAFLTHKHTVTHFRVESLRRRLYDVDCPKKKH